VISGWAALGLLDDARAEAVARAMTMPCTCAGSRDQAAAIFRSAKEPRENGKMKRFGVVLLTALALAGPADAMSGDDLLADLDQLIGKEVLLTDANVGGRQ
jgi:hypothetical protein